MRGTLAAAIVLSGLALAPAPAAAQAPGYQIREPVERAALALPPDLRAPTPDEAARIAALEAAVRHDQPCNTTLEKELEAPRRALLALYEATYGPDHPATARPLISLFCHLTYHGEGSAGAEAREAIAQRLLRIGRNRNQPLIHLAGWRMSAQALGRSDAENEAQLADARMAYATASRMLPANALETAFVAMSLASRLENLARFVEAEPLRLEIYEIFRATPPPDPLMVHLAAQEIGLNLQMQMRADDARPWFTLALAGYEQAAAQGPDNRLALIAAYARRAYSADHDAGERVYRTLLARQEALPGVDDRQIVTTLETLARIKMLQYYKSQDRETLRQSAELWRRVITATGISADNPYLVDAADVLALDPLTAPTAISLLRRAAGRDPQNWDLLGRLAGTLMANGGIDEAFPLYEQAIALAEQARGPNDRETLRLLRNLASQLWVQNDMARARPFYARTLAGYRDELAGLPEGASPAYRHELRGWISVVASEQVKLLWYDRSNGAEGGPEAALYRAFEVTQLAHPSSAGAAISESAARALVAREGNGALYDAWARARDELAAIDAGIRASAETAANAEGGSGSVLAARRGATARLTSAADALRRASPAVFSVLRPEPVPIAALAGAAGQRPLLRDNEALVLLYPGYPAARGAMSRGMVFAVTREGAAWAEIPIDGADLTATVNELRFQLGDDTGRDVRFISRAGETGTPGDRDPRGFRRFDRAAAHRLYQGLFGDPAIAPLLAGKSRWVLVPQGPLLSLPFAALVTAPPDGGAAGDIDPDALRATRWLGLERVVSVLPNVDALRTARSRASPVRTRASGFFGIGDPAFRGVPDPPAAPLTWDTTVQPGTMRSFLRSGTGEEGSLATLRRLSHTGREITAIAQMVGGRPSRTLLQMEATERAIIAADSAGELRRSRLIVFATHALIAGEIAEADVEPALALTPGGAQGDGLLTASEIARFNLDAALIILSACNTAAGSEGGEGFSGLVRAFFQAGAGSVVATHVPLLDDAGERLIVTMIGRLPASGKDVAAALRLAMQEIAADPEFDDQGESLAHPRNWAIFAVVDPQ